MQKGGRRMIRVIMNIYECGDNSGVTLVRK